MVYVTLYHKTLSLKSQGYISSNGQQYMGKNYRFFFYGKKSLGY